MEWLDRLQGALGASVTIERELAGGGMARVFLAYDQQLGRRIVIKTALSGPRQRHQPGTLSA